MLRKTLSYLVLALFVLGWALLLRPAALGGPATYVVISGDSMEPTLHEGDLVILRAQDAYGVGDVVTFPVPANTPGEGALIIHRIVDGTPDAFVIQGDNNGRPDEWTPGEADILGAEWVHLPGAGNVLRRVMDPTLLAAVVGGLVTVLVLMRKSPDAAPSVSTPTAAVEDDPAGEGNAVERDYQRV